jgi:DNA-binding IclR family transcriptional regulator
MIPSNREPASRRLLPGTQTARRALQLLTTIVNSDEPLSLGEAAAAINVNRTTVYRLLRELEGHALVKPTPDGRRFVPGSGLVAIAARVLRGVDVRSSARPFLDRISDATNETIGLHIRDRRYRVCIDVIEGRQAIRRVVPLGERLPLFAGPSGKVILAHLPDDEQASILEWALDEGQPAERIREQLEQARVDGYLVTISDRIAGVGGLSVPIFDVQGVVGALTLSGPAQRWDTAAMQAAVPVVTAAARGLSELLGAGSPSTLSRAAEDFQNPKLSVK